MKSLFVVFLISAFYFLLLSAFPLENDSFTREINPEEMANEFEGDIVLKNTDQLSRSGRNGLTDTSKRWPKNIYGQVSVPFKIQGSYCNKSYEFKLNY